MHADRYFGGRSQVDLSFAGRLHEGNLSIEAIHGLDPSRNGDAVSWVRFANIHGTTAGFNRCPHGNWYFLPWHRAYLQMYEQAVREVVGDPEFAMPRAERAERAR